MSAMEELENEYCPPLDPALFAAIAGDYNLDDNPDSIHELRATLNELKDFAALQESSDFDPSGTSGREICGEDGGSSEPSAPISDNTLPSLETNITGLESNLSTLESESAASTQGTTENTARLSRFAANGAVYLEFNVEEKLEYLKEMFPTVTEFTISHTLKKCDGDMDKSMDELLNFAFIEGGENGCDDADDRISIPKGIEGFGGAETRYKKGRRKGRSKDNQSKTKQNLAHSLSACPEEESNRSKPGNKWDEGKKDIDFICSRTRLSSQAVFSAYHLNAAQLPTTIYYLAKKEIGKCPEAIKDPVTIEQIAELQEEFSAVDTSNLAGLLRLTRNSISAANELVQVMITMPEPPLVEITWKNTPDPSPVEFTKTQPARNRNTVPLAVNNGMNLATSRARIDYHRRAGDVAFNKAQAAYRRGKSDHLMGAAASYYSELGRENIAIAKKETSAAADALVDSQSSTDKLDLHGVGVQDGVRIACERVEIWWESLGDAKYAKGQMSARESFQIITGIGRHSANGTARLGPAVARKLAGEGWRVEVGTGYLTVTGPVRRR